MEIKILENEKSRLKLELVGKTHTMANLLAKELWSDATVDFAGYHVEHPQTKNAILVVEAKDAKKALSTTLSRMKKENKDFVAKFKKVAK